MGDAAFAVEIDEGSDTRKRLLDAAEGLFAEKGFESASLREITAAAEANIAAVNYHFGGRDNLIDAVMARYVIPVNQERIRLLDELLSRETPLSAREVVEAFLRPLENCISEQESRQKLFAQFMGRMMMEEKKPLPDGLKELFREMGAKVAAAFQMAVPSMTEEQAYSRLKFCFSVLAESLMRDEVFEQISEGRLANWDRARMFAEVLDFCEGGVTR